MESYLHQNQWEMNVYTHSFAAMKKIPEQLLADLLLQNVDIKAFEETHENNPEIISIRKNNQKQVLKSDDYSEKVPWSSPGYYLKERPSFTFDPDFHAGCYYVQEASSMFLEQVLKPILSVKNSRILDLCAAPGGKSTHILSLLNEQSLLVSNEVIKTRTPVLSDNVNRWGNTAAYISQNDPKDFTRLPHYFDVIVVDAPCSGSGMFRKDPKAIDEWSPELVEMCSKRQKRILADVYNSLKPGGFLVYSTCSYSKQENENILDWLVNEFDLYTHRIPVNTEWNIDETTSDLHKAFGYRFYPHKLKGEGFFISLLQKKDAEISTPKNVRSKEKPVKPPQELYNWLNNENLVLKTARDEWYAIRPEHEPDWDILRNALHIYKSGVRLGKFAGKDFIPHHELAQSFILSPKISRIELDKETAIRYLRKENILVDTDKTGWVLATYNGNGLGWMKVLPNRINNYYPKEIRILKPIPEY